MADVIVHCGDFTEYGSEKEVLDFLNWYIELPYRHKIFVTGNHDLCLWDVLVTHEPPIMVLDKSYNTHWGNAPLSNRVFQVKPHYHLFGHEHGNQGIVKDSNIVFANGTVLDDQYNMRENFNLITYM